MITISKISLFCVISLLLLACSNNSSLVQDSSKYNPYKDIRVEKDPTLRLILNMLPTVKEERMLNAIVNYNSVAKGWWVEFRCKKLPKNEHLSFKNKVSSMTIMMSALMNSVWGNSKENISYTEIIQMNALSEMSAKKFYGCGKKADDSIRFGVKVVEKATKGVELISSSEAKSLIAKFKENNNHTSK